MMNLNDFEIHIDEMILERGYDYYENDRVISVEEKESNVYEAKVKGSELYTVEVELDDETNIVDTLCDCPYVMGKYCKHQVAVFFALQDMKNIIPGENSLLSQNRAENRADSGAVRRFPAPKKKPDPIWSAHHQLPEFYAQYFPLVSRINGQVPNYILLLNDD